MAKRTTKSKDKPTLETIRSHANRTDLVEREDFEDLLVKAMESDDPIAEIDALEQQLCDVSEGPLPAKPPTNGSAKSGKKKYLVIKVPYCDDMEHTHLPRKIAQVPVREVQCREHLRGIREGLMREKARLASTNREVDSLPKCINWILENAQVVEE